MAKEAVILEFSKGDAKKHSVVYNYGGEGTAFRMSIYVSNRLLEKLEYPEVLRVTFEGKEGAKE